MHDHYLGILYNHHVYLFTNIIILVKVKVRLCLFKRPSFWVIEIEYKCYKSVVLFNLLIHLLGLLHWKTGYYFLHKHEANIVVLWKVKKMFLWVYLFHPNSLILVCSYCTFDLEGQLGHWKISMTSQWGPKPLLWPKWRVLCLEVCS